MSVKASLLKLAIQWTPDILIIWGANLILKGIVHLSDLMFDLDSRKAYVEFTLYGETEPIEILLEDFAVLADGGAYWLVIPKAESNRPWMSNLLDRIVGKSWKIPDVPQYQSQIEIIVDLLKAESR